MEILRTVSELRQWSRALRSQAGSIVGLVPTRGALHAGHASLIRAAHAACTHVAVSIFVNPTQFGPNEDYARYPRSFVADCALAKAEGADVVFAPTVEELYPNGAAQVAVLRRMVADLRLAAEIVVCPIVREPDGLALSSRNLYLSQTERTQALALSRAVRQVEALAAVGERCSRELIEAARQIFAAEADLRVDYIELVNCATLKPVEIAAPGSLFAVAAWVGATRLIDNTIFA